MNPGLLETFTDSAGKKAVGRKKMILVHVEKVRAVTPTLFFFEAFPVSLKTALSVLHGFSEGRILERLFAHE